MEIFASVLFCFGLKQTNLYDMVLEANILFLLPTSILYVENTDEVGCPASHEAIEYLEYDP